MKIFLLMICVLTTGLSLSAQEKKPVALTEAEVQALWISQLQGELDQARFDNQRLRQELLVTSIYQSHGWSKDDVSIRVSPSGEPVAVAVKKDTKVSDRGGE